MRAVITSTQLQAWGKALLELGCYYLLAFVVIDTAPADLAGWGLIAYAVVVSLLTIRLTRLLAAKVAAK